MVDARLPDGSRVNVIVHPLSIGGPFLTDPAVPRRPVHRRATWSAWRTMTEQVAHFTELLRARPPQRRGERRDRHRQDDPAQRPLRRSSRPTSASSPSRTPKSSSSSSRTCSASRPGPPTSRGGARSASVTSSATRCGCGPTASWSARPGRRGARHAPGDEHRPRRVADHRPLERAARHAVPHRDDGPHGRHGPAGQGHPRADGVRPRPHRPPVPAPRRDPSRSPTSAR